MKVTLRVEVPTPTVDQLIRYMYGAGFYYRPSNGWMEWYYKPQNTDYLGGIIKKNHTFPTDEAYQRHFGCELDRLITVIAKRKGLQPLQVWEAMINA